MEGYVLSQEDYLTFKVEAIKSKKQKGLDFYI